MQHAAIEGALRIEMIKISTRLIDPRNFRENLLFYFSIAHIMRRATVVDASVSSAKINESSRHEILIFFESDTYTKEDSKKIYV